MLSPFTRADLMIYVAALFILAALLTWVLSIVFRLVFKVNSETPKPRRQLIFNIAALTSVVLSLGVGWLSFNAVKTSIYLALTDTYSIKMNLEDANQLVGLVANQSSANIVISSLETRAYVSRIEVVDDKFFITDNLGDPLPLP